MTKFKIVLSLIVVSVIGYFGYQYYLNNFSPKQIINNDFIEKDSAQTSNMNDLFSSEYYFKGKDIHNYVQIENSCFRIVSISSKNYLKLAYLGQSITACEKIEKFDKKLEYGSNNSFVESNIYKYLEEIEEDPTLISSDFPDEYFVDGEFNIGHILVNYTGKISDDYKDSINNDFTSDIVYKSKYGIISAIEYAKSLSGTPKSLQDISDNHSNMSYLYNGFDFWTSNSLAEDSEYVWAVVGGVTRNMFTTNKYNIMLTMYLDNNHLLRGEGTALNPYKVL